MANITLGKINQVDCEEEDFYKFLGYLATHPQDINIVFEHNSQQGAWGNEGRIQFKSDFVRNYFGPLGINVTAGIKNRFDSRLNCNELFEILKNLGFNKGAEQDYAVIRNNIPTKFQKDFDKGIKL